ncbi:MAG TPA: hypothetical protein VF406_16190 [Thermodesulfobacteriota bacterium]
MAKYFPGPLLAVVLDDDSGTPVDVSRYVRSVDLPEEVEQLDATAFQATGLERQPGFSSGQIVLGGNWDPVLFRLLHGIKRKQAADPGFTVTYAVGPEGTTPGKVKYTGECILSQFDRGGDVGATTDISATFRITGDNTETTWS